MMGGKVNSRAYLSRFNFGGGEQNKKSICAFRRCNRLHLAMTLKEEGNVLLLDEPTNDLDVNTSCAGRRIRKFCRLCCGYFSRQMVSR
jgi:ATPase subunit of ABC transporter with duplicated ATPase domains